MAEPQRFLRISKVRELTGLAASTIYERMAAGRFPKPVPLGEAPNSPVAWIDTEIAQWQADRIAKRNAETSQAA